MTDPIIQQGVEQAAEQMQRDGLLVITRDENGKQILTLTDKGWDRVRELQAEADE